MDVLTVAGLLGLLCTKLVDTIKHMIPRKVPDYGSVLLSLGLGVGFAYLLDVNLFARVVEVAGSGARGMLLTGLTIGAFGSGFYEALDVVSTKASEIKTRAKVRRGA